MIVNSQLYVVVATVFSTIFKACIVLLKLTLTNEGCYGSFQSSLICIFPPYTKTMNTSHEADAAEAFLLRGTDSSQHLSMVTRIWIWRAFCFSALSRQSQVFVSVHWTLNKHLLFEWKKLIWIMVKFSSSPSTTHCGSLCSQIQFNPMQIKYSSVKISVIWLGWMDFETCQAFGSSA